MCPAVPTIPDQNYCPAARIHHPVLLCVAPIRREAGEVVVVNNASTDETRQNARQAGATVLEQPRRGYGNACLRGLAYAMELKPDVVVFLDGDYSDHPEEMTALIAPIADQTHDFVIGSRIAGRSESGAMLFQARLGNRLACLLMRLFWGVRYSDLGPFRAIRFPELLRLKMQDETFGWTIEMQIKAALAGLRICEIPVSYRRRVGVSKITGTMAGTVKASWKILWTIFKFALTSRRIRSQFGTGHGK